MYGHLPASGVSPTSTEEDLGSKPRNWVCAHTFWGGIDDDFATLIPHDEEYVVRSANLESYLSFVGNPTLGTFDEGENAWDHWFAHSVQNLPNTITGAVLEIRLRPCRAGQTFNDVLSLGLDSPNQTWLWSSPIANLPAAGGSWPTDGPAVIFTLDLSNLPGGVDLRSKMNADQFLDIRVSDDTRVDYVKVDVISASQNVYDPTLLFTQDPLIIGSFVDFTVDGANPGDDVYFIYSLEGVGDGPCIAPLGGFCLCLQEPARLFDVVNTGSGSSATSTQFIPMIPIPQFVATQALVLFGGSPDAAMTQTIYAPIFF